MSAYCQTTIAIAAPSWDPPPSSIFGHSSGFESSNSSGNDQSNDVANRVLKQRCLQRLNQVRAEQQELANRLQQQTQACDTLAGQLAGLIQTGKRFKTELQSLGNVIHKAQVYVLQLGHETEALTIQANQIAQVGHDILQQAQVEHQVLMAGQHIAREILSTSEKEAHQVSNRIKSLTNELDQQIVEANHSINAIQQSQITDRELEPILEVSLGEVEQTGRALQTLTGKWQNTSQQLGQLTREFNSGLQEVKALSELVHSSPTLYALLENLRDYQYERVELWSGGLEVFLVNEEGRRVAIASTNLTKQEDMLLDAIQVEINLDGYNLEEEPFCELELDRMLEMDDVVIKDRKTLFPKRGPGGQARIKSSSNSDRHTQSLSG